MKKHPKVLCVIPARLGSTRLPRKVLLPVAGKPLVYYTWRQAMKAKWCDAVIIATDSKEVMDTVTGFNAIGVMTSSSLKTGSDRVAASLKKFKDFSPDIVVNLQGDEPLMPPRAIDAAINVLIQEKKAVMSTIAVPSNNEVELASPNIVKVVLDNQGRALYFSRSRLPYPRAPFERSLKHVGLYAFRRSFLETFIRLKQSPLEKAELLEQLRALENGYPIHVATGAFDRTEVNTPEEFEVVRRILESATY